MRDTQLLHAPEPVVAQNFSPVELPYHPTFPNDPPTLSNVGAWPDVDQHLDQVGRNLLRYGGVDNLWRWGGRLTEAGKITFPEASSAAYATLESIVRHQRCFRYRDDASDEWWVRVGNRRPTKHAAFNALAVGGNNSTELRVSLPIGPHVANGEPRRILQNPVYPAHFFLASRIYDHLVEDLSSNAAETRQFHIADIRRVTTLGYDEPPDDDILKAFVVLSLLRVRTLHLPVRKWQPRVVSCQPVIRGIHFGRRGTIRLRYEPKFLEFVLPPALCS